MANPKTQKWMPLGRVFELPPSISWAVSHASNVFAELINQTSCRFYFSARDKTKASSIGYVDVDLSQDTPRIIQICDAPVLKKGAEGRFDDRGIALGNIITINNQKTVYYMGWHHDDVQPWTNTIGRAIWNEDTQNFEPDDAPVLGLDDLDPYTLSYPYVMHDEGIYKMWYGSHLTWGVLGDNSDMKHVIKYATSPDGMTWTKTANICIPALGDGVGVSRPSVYKRDGVYHMWYGHRVGTYRIGYARSDDGIEWTRYDDCVDLPASSDPEDWDYNATSYPHVFEFQGDLYMVYNGARYGEAGFGLATLSGGL